MHLIGWPSPQGVNLFEKCMYIKILVNRAVYFNRVHTIKCHYLALWQITLLRVCLDVCYYWRHVHCCRPTWLHPIHCVKCVQEGGAWQTHMIDSSTDPYMMSICVTSVHSAVTKHLFSLRQFFFLHRLVGVCNWLHKTQYCLEYGWIWILYCIRQLPSFLNNCCSSCCFKLCF